MAVDNVHLAQSCVSVLMPIRFVTEFVAFENSHENMCCRRVKMNLANIRFPGWLPTSTTWMIFSLIYCHLNLTFWMKMFVQFQRKRRTSLFGGWNVKLRFPYSDVKEKGARKIDGSMADLWAAHYTSTIVLCLCIWEEKHAFKIYLNVFSSYQQCWFCCPTRH